MKGFGGGMQALMRQANQMQARMKKGARRIGHPGVRVAVPAAARVKVIVTGDNLVKSVVIQPDVISSGDSGDAARYDRHRSQ